MKADLEKSRARQIEQAEQAMSYDTEHTHISDDFVDQVEKARAA